MYQYDAIFFDLDGTLLPMDLEKFTNGYFGLLARRFSQYDSKALIDAVWQGTAAMTANDGSMTNEERFWQVFSGLMGREVLERQAEFQDFYHTDFHQAKAFTAPTPLAKLLVTQARQRAKLVVLATNPLFPTCGVESRLSWLDLAISDFDYVTTYENASYCKPNPAYYQHICQTLQLDPAQCLMIGNDLKEDAQGASQAGLQIHVVTDCLIPHGLSLDMWPHSTLAELQRTL